MKSKITKFSLLLLAVSFCLSAYGQLPEKPSLPDMKQLSKSGERQLKLRINDN
jgi:hypothetical protein